MSSLIPAVQTTAVSAFTYRSALARAKVELVGRDLTIAPEEEDLFEWMYRGVVDVMGRRQQRPLMALQMSTEQHGDRNHLMLKILAALVVGNLHTAFLWDRTRDDGTTVVELTIYR
jgi:hypothetical protein